MRKAVVVTPVAVKALTQAPEPVVMQAATLMPVS